MTSFIRNNSAFNVIIIFSLSIIPARKITQSPFSPLHSLAPLNRFPRPFQTYNQSFFPSLPSSNTCRLFCVFVCINTRVSLSARLDNQPGLHTKHIKGVTKASCQVTHIVNWDSVTLQKSKNVGGRPFVCRMYLISAGLPYCILVESVHPKLLPSHLFS